MFSAPLVSDIDRRLYPDEFAQWASGGRFVPFAYQRFFARRIAKAIAKGNGRLIINVPSRHGKSEMCSRWLPTWFLDNCPSKNVILAAYGAELAERWGREVRNEFEQNPRLFTKLRDDSKAANRWNTPQGGGMLAVGVGGSVIGFGGQLVIIDDPHKDWNEAKSPTYRRRVVEWFGSTLYSRIEPGGTVVLLMQRLDADDLSGYLIEQHSDSWEVIRLPAIAEANDPMGRKPGEALCPERYGIDDLERIRAGMTAGAWESMYQQRPELLGAGRAYRHFDPAVNEDKALALRPGEPVHLSWDFNSNPGVHCIIGQHDRRADQFTDVHEVFGPRLKTPDAVKAAVKVLKAAGTFTEVHVFGDRSGRTEGTLTTEADYDAIYNGLRDAGYRVVLKVPKANPPVKERLETFNDALCDSAGACHYKVNPLRCPRLVRDLKDVREDEDGLIDKESNADLTHASDAAGYRIHWLRPIRRTPSGGGKVAVVS